MDELRSVEERQADVLAALALNGDLWPATLSGRLHSTTLNGGPE